MVASLLELVALPILPGGPVGSGDGFVVARLSTRLSMGRFLSVTRHDVNRQPLQVDGGKTQSDHI